MKKLGIFMLVLVLALGSNLLLDWLYGVRHPLKVMSNIIRTLHPSEIFMLMFLVLCFIISLFNKRLGKALPTAIRGYLNLYKMPTEVQSSEKQQRVKGR
ncbi:hypothetical protein [Paenibacillus sp. FSL K6-1230]|uniref:hypothetical protein n=1 Tax=Paenibacillus sp. FSL K6-1230 TaxID=2921603 RepID=UPI0030FA9EA1